jgi:hypothetical protein
MEIKKVRHLIGILSGLDGDLELNLKIIHPLCPMSERDEETSGEIISIETDFLERKIHLGGGERKTVIDPATRCFIFINAKRK